MKFDKTVLVYRLNNYTEDWNCYFFDSEKDAFKYGANIILDELRELSKLQQKQISSLIACQYFEDAVSLYSNSTGASFMVFPRSDDWEKKVPTSEEILKNVKSFQSIDRENESTQI